jgi:ribonuclease J
VPVEEDKEAFLAECADAAASALKGGGRPQGRGRGKAAGNDGKGGAGSLEDAIRTAVRRVAREWTGKKPVTEVQIIRLG